MFGGLLVNIASLEDWLSWLQYLSITRYSINVRMHVRLTLLGMCKDGSILFQWQWSWGARRAMFPTFQKYPFWPHFLPQKQGLKPLFVSSQWDGICPGLLGSQLMTNVFSSTGSYVAFVRIFCEYLCDKILNWHRECCRQVHQERFCQNSLL